MMKSSARVLRRTYVELHVQYAIQVSGLGPVGHFRLMIGYTQGWNYVRWKH